MNQAYKKLSIKLLTTFVVLSFGSGVSAVTENGNNTAENKCPIAQARFMHRNNHEFIYMLGNPYYLHPMAAETDDFFSNLDVAIGGGKTWDDNDFSEFFSFRPNSQTFSAGSFFAGNSDFGVENLGINAPEDVPQELRFCPDASKIFFYFDWYIGLNNITRGLFFDIRVPIEYQRSCVDLCACDAGSSSAKTIIDAFKGRGVSEEDSVVNQALPAFECGKIDCCGCDGGKPSRWGVADVITDLGWNFIAKENGHFGVRARVVWPAGHDADDETTLFLFGPRVGSNHWGLGGGVNGHLTLWSRDEDREVNVHFDVNAIHLFKRDEKVLFDLKRNGPGSRYLLLKEFDQDGNFVQFVPGVNVLKFCVKTKFNWQVEGTLMGDIRWSDWNLSFGYNIWGRSEEKIEGCGCDDKEFGFPKDRYGVAGVNNNDPIDGFDLTNSTLTANLSTIGTAAMNDAQQTFLTADDLDIVGSQIPRAIQHTLFAGINYTFSDHDYPFYIGVNGSIAFGNDHKMLDEWKVFAILGIAYS